MSKSFKKTPIYGFAGHSDKPWKKKGNRRYRSLLRMHIAQRVGENRLEEIYPLKKDHVYNVWDSCKDGKGYAKKTSDYYHLVIRK